MNPTIAGFVAFIQQIMGISATYLPTDSPAIQFAYDTATDIVNESFQNVPSAPTSPSIYAQMIYNLAGDTLINIAQDQPGQTYFQTARTDLNINGFVGGVIQSSGDEGTNESMVIAEQIKMFTVANIQSLKTPWGRRYIGYAQSYGNLWGIS